MNTVNDSANSARYAWVRKLAAFFAVVHLIGFMMYAQHPDYGLWFSLTVMTSFLALVVFAALPRRTYAAQWVRSGVLGLSGASLVVGLIKIVMDRQDTIAVVMGVLVIVVLLVMAFEALTWQDVK